MTLLVVVYGQVGQSGAILLSSATNYVVCEIRGSSFNHQLPLIDMEHTVWGLRSIPVQFTRGYCGLMGVAVIGASAPPQEQSTKEITGLSVHVARYPAGLGRVPKN